ncbi:MAG: glutathione transferase [Massilia sp.]
MPALTLYVDAAFTSPWAMSAYIALIEKGLPFDLKTVDLDTGEQTQAPFRELGLTGRVPTLVHGDFVLAESSAIIEYLEDSFPETTVMPIELRQRARCRQVQAWIRYDLQALRAERPTTVIFYCPVDDALSAAGQAAADRLIRIAGRLIDGANLFGDWSIADPELALTIFRLAANGDPVPARLRAYAEAQWQRPSVQQWVALSRQRQTVS